MFNALINVAGNLLTIVAAPVEILAKGIEAGTDVMAESAEDAVKSVEKYIDEAKAPEPEISTDEL